jgi:TRAP-type C4-dicarboxylate transport system permease small subunit
MTRPFLALFGLAAAAPFASAAESYVDGFIRHWSNAFNSQSSIVMVALGVGAVGMFIITRAKWKK